MAYIWGAYIRGLISGDLYPGAAGGLYPGAYIRWVISGCLYPRANIWGLIIGAYIRSFFLRAIIRGLITGALIPGV